MSGCYEELRRKMAESSRPSRALSAEGRGSLEVASVFLDLGFVTEGLSHVQEVGHEMPPSSHMQYLMSMSSLNQVLLSHTSPCCAPRASPRFGRAIE